MQHFSEKNHRGIPMFVLGNTRFFFDSCFRLSLESAAPHVRFLCQSCVDFKGKVAELTCKVGAKTLDTRMTTWHPLIEIYNYLQEANLSIRFSIQTKDVYVTFCLRWNSWRFACAKSGAPEPKRPLLVSVAARKNGALKLECTSLIIHEQHGHRASAGCFIYEVWIPFSNFIRGSWLVVALFFLLILEFPTKTEANVWQSWFKTHQQLGVVSTWKKYTQESRQVIIW